MLTTHDVLVSNISYVRTILLILDDNTETNDFQQSEGHYQIITLNKH